MRKRGGPQKNPGETARGEPNERPAMLPACSMDHWRVQPPIRPPPPGGPPTPPLRTRGPSSVRCCTGESRTCLVFSLTHRITRGYHEDEVPLFAERARWIIDWLALLPALACAPRPPCLSAPGAFALSPSFHSCCFHLFSRSRDLRGAPLGPLADRPTADLLCRETSEFSTGGSSLRHLRLRAVSLCLPSRRPGTHKNFAVMRK